MPSRQLPQPSTPDLARPLGGERPPRRLTRCYDRFTLALRRPVEPGIDEPVPVVAAVVDDVAVVAEHAVRQPVVAHELPDVLHHVQFGALGRQRQQRDVGRYLHLAREVPTGLVEQQDGVPAGIDHVGDFLQVQAHRGAVAEGQNQRRALALTRTDGTEDVGGRGALVLRRGRAAAAPCPAARDLVLLTDSGLVGEPDLYGVAVSALVLRDACQRGGEVFLNVSTAPSAWAWCRGRAESLR